MPRGITVVVPTVGRETLANTLASLSTQLHPEDAVVVVSEGENLNVQELVQRYAQVYDGDWSYVIEFGGNWGHPNRNYVFDHYVHTSHVWTIDDDDVAASGAMDRLREHMDDPWAIFKMTFKEGHFASGVTCWREQRIQPGDIGTPMLFAPLTDARFGLHYMGDLDYAFALQEILGPPIWVDDVVALIRPLAVEE